MRKQHMIKHHERATANQDKKVNGNHEAEATETANNSSAATAISIVNVAVPASSLSSALEAVPSTGIPLVGSTIRLQLDGNGVNSLITHLKVDQELLAQLARGGNINVLIDSSAVDSTPTPSENTGTGGCTYPAAAPVEEGNTTVISTRPIRGTEAAAAAKRHSCPKCSKSFSKPSQLERHLRVHTGEKSYACHICKRAFSQKSSLQFHLRRHQPLEERESFPCPYCAYPFTLKCNLKAHISRAHANASQ